MDGSGEALKLFGVTLIGATPDTFRKLILTIAFVAAAWIIVLVLRALLRLFIGSRAGTRFHFWARQVLSLIVAAFLIVGVGSIWFDNPARMAGVLGLIGAGLAFAMQRVITAVAGYFVILRGNTFNVGDRIVMGGVRGDVVALSFMQTTIMEMGQSPKEQGDSPSMWVRSRQFTGRLVTVTNAKIFDEPVYNYSHQFPYIWDEISLPVSYRDDRDSVEKILLDAARRHALTQERLGHEEIGRLNDQFGLDIGEVDPRVYWRITDNWLELTVRYLAPDHGGRGIKDAMTREILEKLKLAKIEIASATYDVVGMPPVRVELTGRSSVNSDEASQRSPHSPTP